MKAKYHFIVFFVFLFGYIFGQAASNNDVISHSIILRSIIPGTAFSALELQNATIDIEVYNDSTIVSSSFTVKNLGQDGNVSIGLPPMNLAYWNMDTYTKEDKKRFAIAVNGIRLNENQIRAPKQLEYYFDQYAKRINSEKSLVAKRDSIDQKYGIRYENGTPYYPNEDVMLKAMEGYRDLGKWFDENHPHLNSDKRLLTDSLLYKAGLPWYEWEMFLRSGETKQIDVTYQVPSGMGFGANYRYVDFQLNPGAKWQNAIKDVKVIAKFHDVSFDNVEEIRPALYNKNENNKEVVWLIKNLRPTANDNIYIRYYNPEERKKYEKEVKKLKKEL